MNLKMTRGARFLFTLTLLIGSSVGFVSCIGPQRAFSTPSDEIGAKPAPGSQPNRISTDSSTQAVTQPPRDVEETGTPNLSNPPAAFSAETFASEAAQSLPQGQALIVVLPAFNVNPLFRRFEVSQLGERLGKELEVSLRRKVLPDKTIITAEEFKRRLEKTNRSLGDLMGPQEALELAARIGASYVVRGLISSSETSIGIEYELVNLSANILAESRQKYSIGQTLTHQLYRELKGGSGAVKLSNYRIGVLAPVDSVSLRGELHWIITLGVHELLTEVGASLKDQPLAVLPTKLPRQYKADKIQRALRRAINKEKQRFIASGLSEAEAWRQGPVRILGRTFQRLEEAEDRLEEQMLDRSISKEGELSSTISRIIFDKIEDLGPKSGVDLIPHEQLVSEVLEFSNEETELVGEGVLDPKIIEKLKVQGAKTLLFSEIIENGDTFEFSFRIRKLENLKALTQKQGQILEPRFAPMLGRYLTKS